MSKSLIRLFTVAAIAGSVVSAHATVSWNFTNLITGDPPQGSNWATLTIQDTAANEVELTLLHNSTSASPQFLSELWLNLSAIPANLDADFNSPITSVSWGANSFNNAGNRYDVNIDLATSQAARLDVGESVSWIMSGTGLDEQDFNILSTPQGGNTPQYAMLHLQGISGGGSVKLGAVPFQDNAPGPAPVPEPATLAVLGVGAATLLRRRKRSQ